jgi:hypothetical protein
MTRRTLEINRAPVFTLWAAIVAERLGHEKGEALSLGKAVAGLNAQAKGQRLGIYEPAAPSPTAKKGHPEPAGKKPAGQVVMLMGRHVPVTKTPQGLRAASKDKPIDAAAVEKYLEQKFGDALEDVTEALKALAKSRKPADLAHDAYALYERFRPKIPAGTRGWGAKGALDLDLIRQLASEKPRAR